MLPPIGANKQFINLLYINVKDLTSISNCCIGPKCVSSINDTKPYLCVITILLYFFISRHYNHLRTNEQLINLRYNDLKNFSSILSFCIGPTSVSSNNDMKALSLRDNHCYLFLYISRHYNHLWKNKQIINLLYNDI